MSKMIISNDSYEILEALYTGAPLPSPVSEDCLRQLKSNGLARYSVIDSRPDPSLTGPSGRPLLCPVFKIDITEDGKSFVERHREDILSDQETSDYYNLQIDALNKIADELERRVSVAEADAEQATKDARRARIQSWIAIAISAIAIVVPILL